MSTSNFQGISVAERILSLQDAWDEIARSPDLVKVSEAQGAELDLRLDAHRQAPDDVQSWDEVKRELAR